LCLLGLDTLSYIFCHRPLVSDALFYELWARWADEDRDFWQQAAEASRALWRISAHPETGLTPNYSEFSGEPVPWDNYGEYFYADAWRTAMHIAVDYAWFAADPWQVEQSNRLLRFFNGLGLERYNSRFLIDGTPAQPQHRSLGLIAMNALPPWRPPIRCAWTSCGLSGMRR